MTIGRDFETLIRQGIKALERQADASEKLLELANTEPFTVEPGPPVCPNCGKYNPEVEQLNAGGSGPLNEFVLKAKMACCNSVAYFVPEGFLPATIETINQGRNNDNS